MRQLTERTTIFQNLFSGLSFSVQSAKAQINQQPALQIMSVSRKQPFVKEAFADDVCFVMQNYPALRRHVVQQINRAYQVAAHNEAFPGAIVVSMLRKDLSILRPGSRYVALEKTDGTRYLLLLTKLGKQPFAVLVDRKMHMRVVTLAFPPHLYASNTLFDGELAQSTTNGRFTFLIFDMIAHSESGVRPICRKTAYRDRMQAATALVRQHWKKSAPTVVAEYDAYGGTDGVTTDQESSGADAVNNTFSLRVKRYVPLARFEETFHDALRGNGWIHRGYKIDGFIFVSQDEPALPFRNKTQFKWKPVHTVDFQLMCRDRKTASYDLLMKSAQNRPILFGGLADCDHNRNFLIVHAETIRNYHENRQNVIVECVYDSTQGYWLLEKHRDDKQTPNAVHTVEQTKRNIAENITVEQLVATFGSGQRRFEEPQRTTHIAGSRDAHNRVAHQTYADNAGRHGQYVPTAHPTCEQSARVPFVHPSRRHVFDRSGSSNDGLRAGQLADTRKRHRTMSGETPPLQQAKRHGSENTGPPQSRVPARAHTLMCAFSSGEDAQSSDDCTCAYCTGVRLALTCPSRLNKLPPAFADDPGDTVEEYDPTRPEITPNIAASAVPPPNSAHSTEQPPSTTPILSVPGDVTAMLSNLQALLSAGGLGSQ